jgi:2-polyprenyl-6-methoxyphenol hydroxylase-like FAD-dependent oxidoreductase
MKISIIGAGIGGLSTALALKKYRPDIEVEIFESSFELKDIGAGLALAANAVIAFERLGIKEKVLAVSNILKRFQILTKKGNVINETDNLAVNKALNTISSFSIHRADLQKILIKETSDIKLNLNKRATSFSSFNSKVSIEFADDAHIETEFVIAADGIRSVFRHHLIPNSAIRFAGYTCWRGVTDNLPSNVDPSLATETWDKGKRFGIVPLFGDHIYWFACINSTVIQNKYFSSFKKEELVEKFQDFHDPVREVINLTNSKNILWNDIIDFKPVNHFAFDNILLLGDAAHAATPNMGQGACQAIEDAVILGKTLQKISDIREAFKVYEQKRIKRTTFVVNRSWQLGKIAQLDNPVLAGLRNIIFRLIPKSMSKRQIAEILNVDFD